MTANSYLHEDTVNGAAIVLAVNQPRASVGGGRLAQRLRAFEREARVGCLLLQDDLVWGTSRPATVVGPQILKWPLERAALVCWPLDQAVYLAEVDVAGFALVKDGGESVVGAEAAMERLSAAMGDTELVVVPGGRQQAALERAGYPASNPDECRLFAGAPYATQPAARLFFRKRLLHRQHVAACLVALAVAALALLTLPLPAGGPDEMSVPMVAVPVPRGSPSLSSDLASFGRALRAVGGFRLQGLSDASYDPAAQVMELKGKAAPGSAGRVGQLAEALGAQRLAAVPPGWTVRYPTGESGGAASQDLAPIDAELEALRTLAAHAGFGSKVSLKEAGLPGQRYAVAKVELDSESSGIARVMALAGALNAQERHPNARLLQGSVAVQQGRGLAVSLTVEARGALP